MSSMQFRKNSNNPFTGLLSPQNTGPRSSNSASVPPAINRQNKPASIPIPNDSYLDDHDMPPPYEEVAGNKYGKDEYPADNKSDDESNPFPAPPPPAPRSRPSKSPITPTTNTESRSRNPRMSPEALTARTHTRIMSDDRVRSRTEEKYF
ncbi:unnamed protein product [Ambrosiozyma monospora]|uniref:Unnamed protein product n=1 Tax=Ambrosiozyma monospora TaxID=43982 RepID=A0ACB5UBD6_AMBMO|nr:unnamed protein product [Ambrosiozyma monospora]